MNWHQLFPQFEPELIDLIDKNAVMRSFRAGDVIMRTGQYIKSTVLVLEGQIKIYRENADGGEFLMYYLGPGQACAVSMICAIQSQASEIMAKAEEDTDVLMIPIQLMDEMMNKYKSWYQFLVWWVKTCAMALASLHHRVAALREILGAFAFTLRLCVKPLREVFCGKFTSSPGPPGNGYETSIQHP
ncbi:cyclic nucleotide-binding domain protein, partial [Ostertagia ostertagi]